MAADLPRPLAHDGKAEVVPQRGMFLESADAIGNGEKTLPALAIVFDRGVVIVAVGFQRDVAAAVDHPGLVAAGGGVQASDADEVRLQAQVLVEPRHREGRVVDVDHVGAAVLQMAQLPLESNILSMTIMATKMPFVGRG